MLVIQHLSFQYVRQSSFALRDLNLAVPATGITTLVGRSGIGKSTLMALVAGVYRPSDPVVKALEGTLSIDEHLPGSLRGPRMVSWVPQEPVLLEHLTVRENAMLAMNFETSPDLSTRADARLVALGLEPFLQMRPRSLSGGMKARVSLARALATEPKYLFLDEPFSGLDLPNRWIIYRMLMENRSGQTQTTMMTSHDIPEAALLSDRIVLLRTRGETTEAVIYENGHRPACLDDPAGSLRAARETAAKIEADILSDALKTASVLMPENPSAL